MNRGADRTQAAAAGNARSSIVVCVYNRGEEVQACLQSLLQLTDRDFEIVLVDRRYPEVTRGVQGVAARHTGDDRS